jgi:uncharacterized repeat protein (TIGR03837 family)
MRFSSIDIICSVVDNFGDAGVAYRFAREFRLVHPACRVRLFCDDLKPLSAMCPAIGANVAVQETGGIVFIDSMRLDHTLALRLGPSDVVVEAFGCVIPHAYSAALLPSASAWINLEYLSAEAWVAGYHERRSMLGTAGPKKYFFMPGFTEGTGGVIVDSAVERIKQLLPARRTELLEEFLTPFGLSAPMEPTILVGVVFTYLRGFDSLLRAVASTCDGAYLFVCGELSKTGMASTIRRMNGTFTANDHGRIGRTHVLFPPFLPQERFDALLCLSDFNLVRGEDSLVRAIFAEKPFLWNAYVQENQYQLVKVKAFCDTFAAYIEDVEECARYRSLSLAFNTPNGKTAGEGTEDFSGFLGGLNKLGHATRNMSYFMARNCNLVQKFNDFLSRLP